MSEKIYVQVDGEKIEATGEQLDYIVSAMAETQAELQADLARKEAIETAKASAIAKLQELGLTVEEVKAAFGLEAE